MKLGVGGVYLLFALCACRSADFSLGEVGGARYFGEILWDGSDRIMPPIRDRVGNIYIGFRESTSLGCTLANAEVMVGRFEGGWNGRCAVREGERIVHGWVGTGEDDAFFWSGDNLAQVDGFSGACSSTLSSDPFTAADLNYLSIVPWLWDRPSRRTMIALVESLADPRPFHVVLDVDRGYFVSMRPFEPAAATNVIPLGSGGHRLARIGVMVLKYTVENKTVVDAIFVDHDGVETDRVKISGIDEVGVDAFRGFLAVTASGQTAGLLADGRLLLLKQDSAQVVAAPFSVRGVHVWDDRLWAVGSDGTGPVLAAIENEAVGAAQPWAASQALQTSLAAGIEVFDDRNLPRERTVWSAVDTAIGAFPLVSPYSPSPYSSGAVGWVVAGPSYVTSASNRCRSIAFAPIAAEYP